MTTPKAIYRVLYLVMAFACVALVPVVVLSLLLRSSCVEGKSQEEGCRDGTMPKRRRTRKG